MSEHTVLIVEDEDNLLQALRYNLEREGYGVYTAIDGERGLYLARRLRPGLVIADVMLPRLDGFELCRILRRETNVPIVMLTARGEEIDRIVGLELGADDYVTKPFSMRELMVRVRNLLKRAQPATNGPLPSDDSETEVYTSNDLEVDLVSHSARCLGRTLDLKPREFELLALLVTNKGRAFTRQQLLDRLWGQDYMGDERTVDVHIRWLRAKIEPEPSDPSRIVTIRGVGYRFDG